MAKAKTFDPTRSVSDGQSHYKTTDAGPNPDYVPTRSVSEGPTETIDDSNKAVIDNTPPVPSAPMPLDMRIAAMLGMGLDTVRERMKTLDKASLLSVEQFVEAKSHPDLAAMMAPSAAGR